MSVWENEFTTPGTSARIWLVLQVDEITVDTPGNQSLCNIYGRMEERVNANPYNLGNTASGAASVDGSVWSAGGLDYDFRTTNATIALFSTSKWIAHDADGTKTIGVSESYNSGDSILGTAAISDTMVLTAIPRGGLDEYLSALWDVSLVDVYASGVWKQQLVDVYVAGVWKQQV